MREGGLVVLASDWSVRSDLAIAAYIICECAAASSGRLTSHMYGTNPLDRLEEREPERKEKISDSFLLRVGGKRAGVSGRISVSSPSP